MKILLLSAYDAMSHVTWRERLVAAFPEHEWQVCSLPPRYFSWRSRGNSLTWSRSAELDGQFDLLVATSVTDLSALRGLRTNLQGVPAVLYFHENQFAYPDRGAPAHRLERQVTSIYSALAADVLVFNSCFNRDSFLDGSARLLKQMPDGVPAGLKAELAGRSRVIPVPVPPVTADRAGHRDRFTVMWNHRWEHDKGLEELEEAVTQLMTLGLPLTFHLAGQGFRNTPGPITESRKKLASAGMLGQFGFLESRAAYLALLAATDVVFSTAHQEFQGLAVMEAVAAGCIPCVPDSLAYREFFEPRYRYANISAAVRQLQIYCQQFEEGGLEAPGLPARVSPELVRSAWQALLHDLGL